MSDAVSDQNSKKSSPNAGIRALLRKNLLFIDERAVYMGYTDFRQRTRNTVISKRATTMAPRSAKQAVAKRAELATANERSLMIELIMIYLREPLPETMIGNDLGDPAYIPDDGLGCDNNEKLSRRFDAPFRINHMLVAISEDEETVNKALRKNGQELKVPKPDVVYGIRREAFTDPAESEINKKYHLLVEVVGDVLHPFFVWEWKSAEGTIEDAENQACRGGAALINGRGKLNAMARDPTTKEQNGPDPQSIAFSAVTIPLYTRIYVHWCEIKDGALIFHMNKVSNHEMDEEDGAISMRNNIENILKWGAVERFAEIRGVLQMIHKKERTQAVAGMGQREGQSAVS